MPAHASVVRLRAEDLVVAIDTRVGDDSIAFRGIDIMPNDEQPTCPTVKWPCEAWASCRSGSVE